jgi:hypothetical protein
MHGNQTWSVGLGVQQSQASPPTPTQLDAWLTDLDADLQGWWTASSSLRGLNAANVEYHGARAYAYAANQTTAVSQAEHLFSTALVGAATTNSLPTQTSIVSSMLSGSPGRSHRGRRYLPLTSSPLTLNQLIPGLVDALVDAEVNFLEAVNSTALGTGTGSAVIVNNKDFPDLIRSVRIDSEPDVQRRRADKIVATYFKRTVLT